MAGKVIVLKPFNCPSCGAPQKLRAAGFTTTYVCSSCGAHIDVSGDEFKVLRAAAASKDTADNQILPLGARGTFPEGTFEVIGYMTRCDKTGQYVWSEYLLFNPFKGFRWLMEMNYHWNFVTMIQERPGQAGIMSINFDGRNFKRFLQDQAHVRFVSGEFYWQVKAGDTVNSCDYIAPPYGISCESDSEEVVWSIMEYMPPKTIQTAFKMQQSLPAPIGISPTMPSPAQSAKSIMLISLGTFVCLLLLQLIFSTRAQKAVIVPPTRYAYMADDPLKVKNLAQFQVLAPGNIEVEAIGDVDNNWLALNLELVNADTKESDDERELEISYYHGSDSDGAWTEGSTRATALFSAVPPGNYYITTEGSADPAVTAMQYSVGVRYDVPYWGNFWAAFCFLIPLPLFMLLRRGAFESKRWADSE